LTLRDWWLIVLSRMTRGHLSQDTKEEQFRNIGGGKEWKKEEADNSREM
jgi:hypothetical protein